jgi:hypothetical protein
VPGRPGKARALARGAAEAEIEAAGDVDLLLGGRCDELTAKGRKLNENIRCKNQAGLGTHHPGYGPCASHGGNSVRQNAKGAWVLMHAMIGEDNVTPWQAILGEVRRTSRMVSWLDMKVAEAPSDEALLLTRDEVDEAGTVVVKAYAPWVAMRERERDNLRKVSKMALDAGVAERLVAQVEYEGQMLATFIMGVLNAPGLALTDEQMETARGIVRTKLLELESGGERDDTIDGEVMQ